MGTDHDLLTRPEQREPVTSGRGGWRAKPGPAVVAATAVVLVALVATAVVAILDRDGEPVPPVVTLPVTTVAPRQPQPADRPLPANSPRPRASIPVPASPPLVLAAATTSRLVVLNAQTGAEARQLEQLPTTGTPEMGPPTFAHVALTPDGTTVYYVTCCEPAVGTTRSVPRTGGEPVLFADGLGRAVSPDGMTVAVANGVVGVVLFARDGSPVGVMATPSDLAVRSLAWSPDSQRLAVVTHPSRLYVPAQRGALIPRGL